MEISFGSPLPDRISAGTTHETVVSINDDDHPVLTVNFGAGAYSVEESDDTSTPSEKENEVTVTVTLSAAPEREVIIPIQRTNRGASDSDYSISTPSLTFGATETEQTFTFTAEHDTEDDDDESVQISFGSPLPDRVSAGTTRETVVSINDDDHPVLTVNFGAGAYSVEESDDTSTSEKENEVTVTVTLSAAPEREVIIPIRRTNRGASDSDYSGVPTSLTFGATETEQTFTFTAADDAEDDDDESVEISFDSPLPDRISAGTTHETVVSINDDDHPVLTVNFGAGAYSVEESDDTSTPSEKENEVTVTVTLSAAPRTRGHHPDPEDEPGGVGLRLLRRAHQRHGRCHGDGADLHLHCCRTTAKDDDDESVEISFGSPLPDRVSAGTTRETVVSINDDDHPVLTVNFGAGAYSVEESDDTSTPSEKENEVTVTVTLSAAPEREVIIPIRRTNRGASDSDYSGVDPPASHSVPRRRSRPSPSLLPMTRRTTTTSRWRSASTAHCPTG